MVCNQGVRTQRTARIGECFAKFAEPFIRAAVFVWQGKCMSTATTTDEKVVFNFQDLQITHSALAIHFFDENVVILLKDIAKYDLKWHLHDPIFAKKYWFLELTVRLNQGEEQAWPIAIVKFNHLDDKHELREQIERKVRYAMNLAVSRRDAVRLRKK